MRKFIFVFAFVVGIVGALNAQVSGKAIGARFNYSGGEISYLHPLGDANRLEIDLGSNSWGLAVNGVYQWVKDLSTVTDGMNWYYGFGAAAGLHNYTYLGVGVLGQIGVEYNFQFPLNLSLDYRPGLYVAPGASTLLHGAYDGFCLSARYRF